MAPRPARPANVEDPDIISPKAGGDKAAGALERWNKFFNESHDSIATDMEVYMTSPRDAESGILQKPDVDARSKAAKHLSVGGGPAVGERTGGAGIQRERKGPHEPQRSDVQRGDQRPADLGKHRVTSTRDPKPTVSRRSPEIATGRKAEELSPGGGHAPSSVNSPANASSSYEPAQPEQPLASVSALDDASVALPPLT